MTAQTTVGHYLVRRLEEVGVKHIFGVPGDYVLGFFDYLEKSSISVVGTCNELNAGYAADGYARVNGVGAVTVTYGVGGFSLLNAAVGMFAERVPVIIISGAPKTGEQKHRHQLHHTIGDMKLQSAIYEKITAASAVLLDGVQAPRQIDETIATCLRLRRPVYIEIPLDIVEAPCAAPGPFNAETTIPSHAPSLDEAVKEAVAMLAAAKKVVVLAGVEAHRLGIRRELEDLIDHTGYPFATTLLGKAVIPEKHPHYIGVYCGSLCREETRKAVEEADVVLSLGNFMTDIDIGVGTARLDPHKTIIVNSDKVWIRYHTYGRVSLKDFTQGLRAKLPSRPPQTVAARHPSEQLAEGGAGDPNRKITAAAFYRRVNRFIQKNDIIVSDTGDCLFASGELYLPEGVEYIGQAFYLSIGYAVPAAMGVQLAAGTSRPIVFVGDGAFQMTAQELSTIIRQGLNPVIFLLNNEGYTIERLLDDGAYNDIQNWKYALLPEVFGGSRGSEVTTEGELEKALEQAKAQPDRLAFIEVHLDKLDCSSALKNLGKAARKK